MELRAKVLESLQWMAIAQLLSQVMRIVVSIYVIRQLENEHMAFIALSDTIVNFLDMFSSLGLGAVIVSKKNLTAKDLSNIAGLLYLINLSLMILVLVLSGFLADFYNTPELSTILKVMSIGFLFAAAAAVPNALLVKNMRFKEISAVQLIASFVGAITSLVLVNMGFEYWSIVLGGSAFIIFRSVGLIFLHGKLVIPSFGLAESRQHLNFGGYVMAAGIFWYLYKSMDVAIAGRYWSAEALGIYAVAVQLTVMPLNRFLPLLKQVALPAYSRTVAEDGAMLQSYITKSLRLAMALCFSVYLGIAAVSPVLITVILGEKWAASALPLALLCFAAPFKAFLELLDPAVIASGNPKHLFSNSVFITVVMLGLFMLAATTSQSTQSFALVWAIGFPVLSLVVSHNYCRAMNVEFKAILRAILSPMVFSLIMWAAVRAYIEMALGLLSPTILLCSAIALGAGIFVLMCFTFDRALLREFFSLVRRKGQSKPG